MDLRNLAVLTLLALAWSRPAHAQDATDGRALEPLGGATDEAVTTNPNGLRAISVATKTSIPVSTNRVDGVIATMNVLISRSDYPAGKNSDGSDYPADIACKGVSYSLLNGAITKKESVPDVFASGVPGYDWSDFRKAAPADVYIVNSITCGSVPNAAGCAPLGGSPRVVTAGSGLNGQVWVHEDLHTVGISHSNPEVPCPTNYRVSKEGQWRRIMYCRVNEHAKGLLQDECQKIGGQVDMAVLVNAVADASGLSDTLRQLLAYPQNPDNSFNTTIYQLSPDDINSIRSVLAARSDIELLRGAVLILGQVGNISDSQALISFIEDSSLPFDPLVTEAKLAVPAAVSAIASRLDQPNASRLVAQVLTYAQLDKATQLLGSAGSSLVVQAVLGTAEAKDKAIPILESAIAKSEGKAIDFAIVGINNDLAVVDAINNTQDVSAGLLSAALRNAQIRSQSSP